MILFFASVASAAVLTVEADGSGDYSSINAALSAAASGDEIQVGAGTWYETLRITSKPVTITGSDTPETVIIDATGSTSAIEAQVSLTLRDLTVRNTGGRGLLVSGATVDLSGVIFDEVGSLSINGGALWANGGTVTLSESTIDGGQANAGMIYGDAGASISLTDSTIQKSEAIEGAGIYLSSGTATLAGCTLEQLYATNRGGAVYLSTGTALSASDTTFYANLTESGSGSAIYADTASIETTNVVFELNYATNYSSSFLSGGAVYLFNGQMTATDTSFIENDSYYGGAIRAQSSVLDLSTTTFSDNYASYGGGIYLDSGSTLTDSGSQWVGNEGYYNGAAVYAYSQYEMTFEGSLFLDNYARWGHGAGVYGYYGNDRYTDVTFEDNTSYYGGSAIYGYYTYGNTTIEGCTFTENTSSYHAGAVYSFAYNNLVVTDSTFTRNETEYGHGGAIHNYYGTATIQRSQFTSNRSLHNMGGAIYSYLHDGAAPNLVVEDSHFDSNEAFYHGGAISANYNRYEIRRSTFHVNDAGSAGMGGAIFTQDTVSGLAQQNKFTGNNAAYGGAVLSYDAWSQPSEWVSNIFMENTADTGGAMVVSGSDVTTIVNNTFVGNTSVSEGGTLVLVESGVTFVNNAVTHSTAGEGVYVYDAHSLDGSTFAHNAWYQLTDGMSGGKVTDKVLMENSLSDVSPGYVSYTPDGNASNDSVVLLADSALIDAGDPTILDPDGSVSDIGAWGGSGFLVEDADGDGFENWLDCDDTNPDAWPGATEIWYDGVNSDCTPGSDYDADGDGVDASEHGGDDCDDTDPAVQSDCDDSTDTGGTDTGGTDTGGTDTDGTSEPDDTDGVDDTDKDDPSGAGCATTGGLGGGLWLVGLLGLGGRARRPVSRRSRR